MIAAGPTCIILCCRLDDGVHVCLPVAWVCSSYAKGEIAVSRSGLLLHFGSLPSPISGSRTGSVPPFYGLSWESDSAWAPSVKGKSNIFIRIPLLLTITPERNPVRLMLTVQYATR